MSPKGCGITQHGESKYRRREEQQVWRAYLTIIGHRQAGRIFLPEPEREQMRLPHLVWHRPLEEEWPGWVSPRLRRPVHQPRIVQPPPPGFGTARQHEGTRQGVGDFLTPYRRCACFNCRIYSVIVCPCSPASPCAPHGCSHTGSRSRTSKLPAGAHGTRSRLRENYATNGDKADAS